MLNKSTVFYLSQYTYQDCSISTSKSQASSSCQLQELSRPGKMWICKCSTTGCNNVTSMVNLLPSFSETPPPLPTAIDVTTMTTDSVPLPAAGVLKSQRAVQPYGHRQCKKLMYVSDNVVSDREGLSYPLTLSQPLADCGH